MPRITSPFRRHSGSWFVHSIGFKGFSSTANSSSTPPPPYSYNGNIGDEKVHNQQLEVQVCKPQHNAGLGGHLKTGSPSSFLRLLRLLLWKNYKLLIRNKLSTAAELLLPLLFTILIVAIRFYGIETQKFENATVFEPFEPSTVPGTIRTCCNQIFYTPTLPVIQKLMEKVQRNHFNTSQLSYSFSGFDTEEELLRAYANSSSGMYAETDDGTLSSTVLAGIVFTSGAEGNGTEFNDNVEYSLRFPAALRSQSGLLGERFTFGLKQAWFTEILYPIIQPLGPRAKDQINGGEPGYWSEGFLYLQQALDSELLKILSSPQSLPEHKPSLLLQRFPYPPYLEDEFLVVLQPFLPLTLVLSFIYTVCSICKTLVTEKEQKIHESMKMMGLSDSLHWTAWFLTFLIVFSISALLITILLKVHLTSASKSGGLAVLPNSDPSLIFFCFLIHGFQLISFCFFISSIFRTANGAAITSSVLWFMLFLPFPFLQPRYSILSSRVKILWSLLSNMGICFCCQVFCMFEGSREGAQWGNMFQGVTPDDTFCIGDCLAVMFFNGLVYFLGSIYVSAVWPGEFGVGQKWYFFLRKDFWFGGDTRQGFARSTTYDDEPSSEKIKPIPNPFYERTPKSLVAGISVHDLRKDFGEVSALNGINLSMFKNETFCLLGKNGAGKSTLVNIITGLYPPTSGSVTVNGQSDLSEIRKSLGVCPQDNILFELLTVEEHLQFFAQLKGMSGKVMKEEVEKMLMSIRLVHKRNALVQTLSGGMKRRLCVGIAFINSETVILDEPSSGLDVEARKAVWDLIESEKENRTLLCTTHAMEEAELLADRIAVMVNGEVKCCGSPLFLNKKYNGGYNLTLVMEEVSANNSRKMTDFIHSYLPESTLIRTGGKELTYALPESKSTEFPILFNELERNQRELGIETFGARLTSMEDIFLRVNAAALDEVEEAVLTPLPQKYDNSSADLTFINGSEVNINLPKAKPLRNKGMDLILQQFVATVLKKVICVKRRKSLLIGQTLIPMVYLGLVLVVLRTVPGIFDPPPHRFELEHYELFGRTITPVHCAPESEAYCKSYKQYFNRIIHKLVETVPSNKSFMDEILQKQESNIPAFNAKYIIGFDAGTETNNNGNGTVLTGFLNNQPLHTPPLALNALTNTLLLQYGSNITVRVTSHPFPYTNLDTQDTGTYWTVGFHVGYNTAFALTFVVAVFTTYLVKENMSGSTQLQRVSGLHPAIYWCSNFVVDFLTYLLPCFGLLIIFSIFASATEFFDWSLQGYLFILFLAFGWALIPVVYVMSKGFRVPAVGFAGCGVVCAFTGFITILTITVLELPQINRVELATLLHRIFLVFPTYALGRGITQMSINKKLQEKCAGFNLEFLCDAAPDSFCCVKLRRNFMDWQEVGIGKNIVYMIVVGILALICLALMECDLITRIKPYLLALRDKFRNGAAHNSETGSSTNQCNIEEDEDVKTERERVESGPSLEADALVIKDLSKCYGSLKAVDRLTLGVRRGECFGLLGTNGAGKTSSFKILVGELIADAGDAFVCSHSVTHQRRKTHKLIGYCPQFDALLGELTGRETLTLFARLRGVKETEVVEIVEDLSRELGFDQYLDRTVQTYSGGNKRKLSTAVALVGSPSLVLLDEPTSQMDPLARRKVWAALNKRLEDKDTSVLLTSHSLEECEILCSRIAIMKSGRVQCLGSPQQLKHKFGDGFSIQVQIKNNAIAGGGGGIGDEKEKLQRKLSNLSQVSSTSTLCSLDPSQSMQIIDNYLRSHFPPNTECILTSSHANYLNYHVRQPKPVNEVETTQGEVSWSVLFNAMESIKEQAGISAYSISQISLEQVFLSV